MPLEIEKKYRLVEEQRRFVIESLDEMDAEYIGEDFEENIIYGGAILSSRNGVVRIRKTQDRTLFTYKQRLPSRSGAKEQIEHETQVKDADSLKKILECLELEPRLVYEKRRKTWQFRNVEIVLDELPFGLYMEIEGSITAIKEAEMILGFEGFETEHETYPGLTAKLGRRVGALIESRFV